MGQNHNLVVVFGIWPKFWWVIAIGVKNNHTKYEPETQQWRPGTGVTMADLLFKICRKWPKIAIWGAIWVPRISMERANCLGTN